MHGQRLNRGAIAVALVSIGFAFEASAQKAPPGSKANPPRTAAQQGGTRQMAGKHGNVPPDDRQFANKAAQAGMAEVAEGKLAQRKGEDEQVKQFGQRMANDHTQANDKLKEIAGTQGLDLPTKPDKKGQGELDKLEKLSGARFDDAYIEKQVSDHRKVIEEFQTEASSGKDSQLRDFARTTLPTLEEHLRLARSAQQGVMRKSASSSGSPSSSTITRSGSSGTPPHSSSSNAKSSSNRPSSRSGSSDSGLKAAREATGQTYAHAEKEDRMPVPKTGM